MQKLEIQIDRLPAGTVAHLRGDATNILDNQILDELGPILQSRAQHIVLDLTELLFIASAALGELIQFRHEAQDQGATLRLAGANPSIEDVLRKTRLVELFPLFPDPDAALRT